MAAGRACPGDSIFDLNPLGVMQDGSPWKGVALCLQRMAWCRLTRLHVGLPSPPAKLARHWTLQYGLGQYGGVQHLPSKRPCFDRYIMVGMGRGVRRGMGYRGRPASTLPPHPTSSHYHTLPFPSPIPTLLFLSLLSLCVCHTQAVVNMLILPPVLTTTVMLINMQISLKGITRGAGSVWLKGNNVSISGQAERSPAICSLRLLAGRLYSKRRLARRSMNGRRFP